MDSVSQKPRKKNCCFDADKRYLLQCHLLGGYKGIPQQTCRKKLAEIFGCDVKTIYNEIRRGTVEHTRSDLTKVREYNGDHAQFRARYELSSRGVNLKIGSDTKLCEAIRELVVGQGYSPYAVIRHFENNGWPTQTRICEKTLYNYIHTGLIAGVETTDLLNKGNQYKEKAESKQYSKAICAMKSIEMRDKEVETRQTFGHWEIDTIKGKQNGSTECLLTMTERKTRYEIAVKMPNAKAESTVAVLNRIEREIGSQKFREMFRTITCDGGPEFMDVAGIELSGIDGQARTLLYFAHPYSAYERGTNENHNRMLRRFFPKGIDFSTVSDEDVEKAVSWMNNYPRRVLGGIPPSTLLG